MTNKELAYKYFQKTQIELDKSALENNEVTPKYYHLKNFIKIALEKSLNNHEYCEKWLLWFKNKTSTLELRDLFKEIGCNYWENLLNSNAIDWLDSLHSKIKLL